MLALSPPLCSAYGWPLELEPISHGQNYIIHRETETPDESIVHSSSLLAQVLEHDHSATPSATIITGDPLIVKKLHHNASERHRRRKINCMYSSLRSLLPVAYQMKKLSIPTTVSYALKYIPELQEEVEGLKKKKETLVLSRITMQGDQLKQLDNDQKIDTTQRSSLSTISASRLNEREVLVHIATKYEVYTIGLSEVLMNLEDEYGLHLINGDSFESSGGRRVFFNLHLQVKGTRRIDCEALKEKLLSLYDKKREQFTYNLGFRQF